jgi:hypothetical protein
MLHLWSTFGPYKDAHGEERTTSHDVRDTFAFISRGARFHVLHEQTHVLLSLTFQSIRRWVDIMVPMDGVWTLANIIISDPT